jgi:hypothetical protein
MHEMWVTWRYARGPPGQQEGMTVPTIMPALLTSRTSRRTARQRLLATVALAALAPAVHLFSQWDSWTLGPEA